MKNKNNTKIILILIVLLLSFSLVSAKNFFVSNSSNPTQNHFVINGTTGFVGIGITNPLSLLQIANDKWISSMNYANNNNINMFKVNEDDEIDIGATLNVGTFEFVEDSGLITFIDMPISATPSVGTSESYVFKIDETSILTIYSEADSSGGIQNERVGIGTINPSHELNVVGDVNITGTIIVGNGWTGNCINVSVLNGIINGCND